MDRVSTASRGPRIWDALLRQTQTQTQALPPLATPPCPLQVTPGLPLGLEQTELQPARQHLRLSAQSSSKLHSNTQPVIGSSWGHTPGFSVPVPWDRWVGVETCQGEPRPVPPAYSLSAPRSPKFRPQVFRILWPRGPHNIIPESLIPGPGVSDTRELPNAWLQSPQSSRT